MNTDTVLVDVAVKDLSGAALDWAVACAVGQGIELTGRYPHALIGGRLEGRYNPSSSWCQGGPLVAKHRILFDESGTQLCAWGAGIDDAYGPDHLTAACRAIVAAKLGDIVKVPACLVMP